VNSASQSGKIFPLFFLFSPADLANLRKYPPGSHPGVILFRRLSLSPLTVNAFIADFIRRTSLEKLTACVAVVDPARVRIRSPQKTRDEDLRPL
jgi:hypothetical protein